MADVRAFPALRYDPARVDIASVLAPPYDVISPSRQHELYERSPYNVVRVEYGEQRPGDTDADNRYTRAARDLSSWLADGVLRRDDPPAMYAYTLEFGHEGSRYIREHLFAVVRLEAWDAGVVLPHEHTLAGPKSDRLELLRATRTQVSPVFALYRGDRMQPETAETLFEADADDSRHRLARIADPDAVAALAGAFARRPLYIADGHHRYETALAYRDECRAHAPRWTGDEPENFVLMALTAASDPGLLVLPTHRVVHVPPPSDALARLAPMFDAHEVSVADAGEALRHEPPDATSFATIGLSPGRAHLLRLRDRTAAERAMPAGQPDAWRRLDVSVLHHAILGPLFGIDDATLVRGGAVSYTQDASEATAAVLRADAPCAFLLRATPVEQVLAVSDAGGRMPQKSTYFFPKLPTGLVMYPFD